ncbi:hypothetical protein ACGFNU_28815 [Spirillospora sp. NPDC048911]|uniref:hypothetical protein n=1 Tax=Spirillospora sp. NPDC048911 TaxID=3364527 RepID=UPI0037113E98
MIFEPARRTRTGVLGWALTGAGAAMVPWMYVLATRLPSTTEVSNWSTAWVGLDAMLAAGLAGTGVLLRRKDPRHSLTAAATAALLAMDAWFDVTTSAPGAERATAAGLAVAVELPLAVACAALAVRGLRGVQPSEARIPARSEPVRPAGRRVRRPVPPMAAGQN